MVLRAFRTCPESPAVNGIHCQGSEGAEKPTHRQAVPRALGAVEKHIERPGPKQHAGNVSAYVARMASTGRLCPEEKAEEHSSGNEQDSAEAPPDSHQTQELTGQSQAGEKESIANSVPPSDSTEEIFKVCVVDIRICGKSLVFASRKYSIIRCSDETVIFDIKTTTGAVVF